MAKKEASRSTARQHAEPRWLGAAEQRTWLQLVRIMVEVPAALDAQLRRQSGLRHFEYGVLARLSTFENDAAQLTQLAADTNSSLSRLSHGLTRLEQRGFLARSPLRGDGRITTARLTPAGRAELARLAPSHVAEVRRLVFDRLTPEQVDQLESICTSLSEP